MPLLFALFMFMFMATVFAQTPKPVVAEVQGIVRSATGGPVARATVAINGKNATTDEQGRFKIDGIPAGRGYQLTAEAPGFVRGAYGARRPGGQGTPLTLAAGQATEDLAILLTPQGIVSGKVVDADGEPVPGAPINLMSPTFSGTTRTWIPRRSATTDDRGEYRMANISPGSYRLQVTDRRTGTRLDPKPPSGSGLITYYPNSGDPLGAAPIEVYAGTESSGINVRLRTARTYDIRGKAIVAATRDPVAGAQVTLIVKGSGALMYLSRQHANTEQDGTFEFAGLEPGSYSLEITPSTRRGKIKARTDVVLTNDDQEDVLLAVHPGDDLIGTIRLEDGDIRSLIPPGSPSGRGMEPMSREEQIFVNAHFQALADSRRGKNVNYRPTVELANTTPELGTTGMGILQEDGTFLVRAVSASQFRFAVELLPPGYFVKSANMGGVDVLRAPLDSMERVGELHIVLSNKAAEVTGVLQDKDGKPLVSIPVALWPKEPLLGLQGFGIRRATTDQNGVFGFQSVPPGEYFVAGWEDADVGLLTSPEFLDRFRSDATAVKLLENDRKQVDAKMISADDIAAETGKLP